MNSHSVHPIIHLSTPKNWREDKQKIAYLTTELDKNKTIKQIVLTSQDSSLFHFIKNCVL